MKQLISRESLQTLSLTYDSHDYLPSLALNCHHCSSSSLVPYCSWMLCVFSAPISLLVILSNHPGICTTERGEYPVFYEILFYSSFLLLFWGRDDEQFWQDSFGITSLLATRVASWHSAFPLLLNTAKSSSKLRLRFYGHSRMTCSLKNLQQNYFF